MFKSIPVMSNEFICIVRTKPEDCVQAENLITTVNYFICEFCPALNLSQSLLSSTKHHWLLNKFLAPVFANRSNSKT